MKDYIINEKLQLINILNSYNINNENLSYPKKRKTPYDPDTNQEMDIESENLNYAVKKDIYSESDIKSNEKIKKVKKENFDILKIKNERNYLNLFTFDFGMSSNNPMIFCIRRQ